MRFLTTLLIGTALALPAMAQTTHPKPRPHNRASTHTTSPAPDADVNKAYMGGGVVLEGAPGGPPPPASGAVSTPPMSR